LGERYRVVTQLVSLGSDGDSVFGGQAVCARRTVLEPELLYDDRQPYAIGR